MRGSIQKRGKSSWRLIFDLDRDQTGKRKQKTITFRGSRRDAEAEINRILAEIKNGGFVDPVNLTIDEYSRQWLAHVATKTSTKTHERYEEIVQLGIIPHLGSMKLRNLRPMHIQNLYSMALKSGRKGGTGGLSGRTVLHYHRILKQALAQAVKWQLLASNPADAVEPPKPEEREMVVLDDDQMALLIDSTKGSYLYIPTLLALSTGMRRGEVLALRWSVVDLDRDTVSVIQTLEKTRKNGLQFKPPKTKKSRRNITLPNWTVSELRKHRVEQAEMRLRLGVGRDDNVLICCRFDGVPINPNTLTSGFASLVKSIEIPRVSFHGLRHSHATQLFKEGVHPKIVQERLGHSTIAVTLDLYSHVLPGMQENAAMMVDRALKAALGKRIENETKT